jgi:hypothetical protein
MPPAGAGGNRPLLLVITSRLPFVIASEAWQFSLVLTTDFCLLVSKVIIGRQRWLEVGPPFGVSCPKFALIWC